MTLVDPVNAVTELEWALDHDARFIVMVGGPVVVDGSGTRRPIPSTTRSGPGSTSRVSPSATTAGTAATRSYLSDWGENSEMEAFRQNPFRALTSANPTQDTFANLLAHGLFDRYPNLRLASIETGADWVFHLFEKLKKSFGQTPQAVPRGSPGDVQATRVGVALLRGRARRAADLLGADHILMGSDYPHAEGLADPVSYIKDLKNFDYPDEDCRLVMRDNGIALSQRRPA